MADRKGQFHFERHNVFSESEIPHGDATEMVARVFFRLSFYPVVQPRDWEQWKGVEKGHLRDRFGRDNEG